MASAKEHKMGTTLFFRESERLSFPKVCVGCGMDNTDSYVNWQVFSPPSSTGKKVWKGANVMFGLATGGIGGAVGGAKFADNTMGSMFSHRSYIQSRVVPNVYLNLRRRTRRGC
jgi:hypothetical protein